MVDLSIVIVNWNTRDLLHQCLSAIYTTTRNVDFEIVVVDNGSADDSVRLVRRDFPNVLLIENEENVGFARANNQAIRQSHSRYVLLLNTDAFVHEGAIAHLLRFMDDHTDAAVAGCKLFYDDGRLQRSCTSFPTLFTEFCTALGLDRLLPRSRLFGQYQMTYWDFDNVREVDAVMGAVMMVRRKAIDEAGCLDERFFMYSEEVDWCFRMKRAGWKVYFTPHAQATHLWGGSIKPVAAELLTQLYRSRVAFFRKHYGSLSALALKGLILIYGVLRVAFWSLRKHGSWDNSGQPRSPKQVYALLRSLLTL